MISIMLEGNGPSKSIIVPGVFSFHRILVITDITTSSDPTTSTSASFCVRVYKWSHTMVEKGIWLHQIDNIEFVRLACFCIAHSEVIPLRIASCVIIRLKDQVIFILVNLDSSAQISTFKPGFKK